MGTEWRLSKRWVPWWAALLLGIPVVGGTTGVVLSALDGSTSFLQLPLFGVFVYVWLMTLLNRTELAVDSEGAWIRTGPLWSGYRRAQRVEKARVTRLLVRVQQGYKGVREHFACVEEVGGEWHDLVGMYYEPEPAAEVVRRVAATWGVTANPTVEWRVQRIMRQGWVVLGWGLAVLVGFVWATVVEIYRYP